MAKRKGVKPYLSFVVVLLGLVQGVEISFDDPQDGFFIKSAYHKFQSTSPNLEKEAFILTHPAEVYKLRAQHGPFEVYQAVPTSFVENAFPDSNFMHRQIMYNMDVSASVVKNDLSPNQTLLQVLIHAQPLLGRKKQDAVYTYSNGGAPQRWCGQLLVEHRDQRLSAVCVLSEKHNACVAGVHLPAEWWHHNSSQVSVYYHVTRVEDNQACASASNSIVPARSISNSSSDQRQLITRMRLHIKERQEMELKDKHLILQIPKDNFYPGAKFDVPVVLEAGSEVQVFVLKAKVRNGLQILGATADPNSPWSIYLEMKDRKRLATVTAMLQRHPNHIKNNKRQEIFRWKFEVDKTVAEPLSVGRIVWTVDYEKNGYSQKSYYPLQDIKFVAPITITTHDQERLVAVFKENEVLNTAVLTGHQLAYPLQVYAIKEDGSFRDVTRQAACRSLEETVLKVDAGCAAVFMDGSETAGSRNATITITLGKLTTALHLIVWLPDNRLEIQLSDEKLSPIRGWKVPRHSHRSPKTDRHGCQLHIQQSTVEVYTRFVIRSSRGTEYFRNRKAYLRVTDLLFHRLRIADPRVASLEGRIIQGLDQGRTEVQVLSHQGQVMASKEIRVSKDKVLMERLLVRVVSGVTLDIRQAEALPGALTAVALLQDKLVVPNQEGTLDIALQYSDGTRFPLKYMQKQDYDLKVSSMNHHVIDVPTSQAHSNNLGIKAVGEGRGELVKVTLRISNSCPKKRSRPLATSFVYVNVDFSKSVNYLERIQSDGNYDNRASDRWVMERGSSGAAKAPPNTHFQSKDEYFKHHHKTSFSKDSDDPHVIPIDLALLDFDQPSQKDGADPQVIPVDSDLNGSPESKHPKSEALTQPMWQYGGLTPLEVGMYALLGVFSVGILVFAVNCVVFMVRYRRKRMPKDRKEPVSQANDWVWIGRATLERNGAVNTRCSQTLMPEEDFNGNQMLMRTHSGSSGYSSACNSNRNSTVSTYKGSECSIRITANPLPDEQASGSSHEPEWDYEAMGLTYDQLMEYFDNLKESTA